MKITWIGHSCFKIEKDGYILIIDPYENGSVPGLADVNETADQVRCTHEHFDHNGRSAVTLTRVEHECPFTIETIDTFHDEVQGAKRGPNKIYIVSDGAMRIAHLGDLGCDLEPEQMERLRNLDVLMIPVGGYYTIDGKQAAELAAGLKPKKVIPMHYRDDQAETGFAEISTVDAFTESMGRARVTGSSEVNFDLQTQVEVLKPARQISE